MDDTVRGAVLVKPAIRSVAHETGSGTAILEGCQQNRQHAGVDFTHRWLTHYSLKPGGDSVAEPSGASGLQLRNNERHDRVAQVVAMAHPRHKTGIPSQSLRRLPNPGATR